MQGSFSICATVKAPADEVAWFVRYHLSAGAERIFLFFDDPEDAGAAQFDSDPRIHVTRCDPNHWDRIELQQRDKVGERRAANARWALQRSREEGIDWMVVIDYDELLISKRPLKELFARTPDNVNVLQFEVWEGVTTETEYRNPFTEVTSFKPYPLPLSVAHAGSLVIYAQWLSFLLRLLLARMLGVKRANRHQFILGHRAGKSAMRTSGAYSHIGSHVPLPIPGGSLTCRRAPHAAVLHFDACGYDRWRWKWGARSSGGLQWTGRAHRWDYMREYELAANAGEETLRRFFQQTKIPTAWDLRVMCALGLIRQFQTADFKQETV